MEAGPTPVEQVLGRFKLPITLRPYQVDSVNTVAPLRRSGLWLDTGTGKTITSIVAALYKMLYGVQTVVVIMPPTLLTNWSRVLTSFPVTHTVYRGTPKERPKLNLDVDFILVGYQMFKQDWDYLHDKLGGRHLCLIADEAQALKNVGSQNYRKFRDFAIEQEIMLLSGTPISIPIDGYAMIKLVSPGIYKTQNQFESIHVAERDFFKRPTKWANLDLLAENLKHNSVRLLKEDVLEDLPELTYAPLYYDLAPAHLKLYNKLADEQMVKLGNGDKIDLTNTSALFQALQQIPCNAEHFSEGEIESTILDLIDEVLDELGEGKLVIFTHYKMTTRRLGEYLAKVGAVTLFGETKDKQAQIDRFIADPTCRVIVMNIAAGGAGIDHLQDVCNELLFVEMPYRSAVFHQAVARLHRSGQMKGVNCRVAIAEKTLQHRMWQIVQDLDSLNNMVIRGPKDIKEALAGR